jgi:hypothetical protein
MCLIAKHYVESLMDACSHYIEFNPDQRFFAIVNTLTIASLMLRDGPNPYYTDKHWSVADIKTQILYRTDIHRTISSLPPKDSWNYAGITPGMIEKFHRVMCAVLDHELQFRGFAGLADYKDSAIFYYEMYKLNLARQMYLPLTPLVTATELADVDKAWKEREYTHDDLEVFLMTLPHIPEAAPVVAAAPAPAAPAPAAPAAVVAAAPAAAPAPAAPAAVAVVAAAPASKKRGRNEVSDLNKYTRGVVGNKMPPKRVPKSVFRADFVNIDDCDL